MSKTEISVRIDEDTIIKHKISTDMDIWDLKQELERVSKIADAIGGMPAKTTTKVVKTSSDSDYQEKLEEVAEAVKDGEESVASAARRIMGRSLGGPEYVRLRKITGSPLKKNKKRKGKHRKNKTWTDGQKREFIKEYESLPRKERWAKLKNKYSYSTFGSMEQAYYKHKRSLFKDVPKQKPKVETTEDTKDARSIRDQLNSLLAKR